MKLNIHIVRHGETLLNKLKRNQGWIDSDLTEAGIDVLVNEYKGVNLPLMDAVYCSDLGRAVKTLEIIQSHINFQEGVNIHYSKLLRERFLGSFEGVDLLQNRQDLSEREGLGSFEEFIQKYSFWKFVDVTKKYDPLSLAEDFNEFSYRIDTALAKIMEEAKKNCHQNILIVSHANTVRYIVEKIEAKEYLKPIQNGKIIELIVEKSE